MGHQLYEQLQIRLVRGGDDGIGTFHPFQTDGAILPRPEWEGDGGL
jgi:hypothetical protein